MHIATLLEPSRWWPRFVLPGLPGPRGEWDEERFKMNFSRHFPRQRTTVLYSVASHPLFFEDGPGAWCQCPTGRPSSPLFVETDLVLAATVKLHHKQWWHRWHSPHPPAMDSHVLFCVFGVLGVPESQSKSQQKQHLGLQDPKWQEVKCILCKCNAVLLPK